MSKMKVINVPVNTVRVCKQHWHREHSDDDVSSIAEEISSVGLIHPITVRQVDGRHELLAGRKRFLAMSDILEMAEVPALVVQADDIQAELISIYENLGQSDMPQSEIDKATKRAVSLEAEKNGTGITSQIIDTVALRTKQKPEDVKKAIKREDTLIPEAKEALRDKKISKSQANELVHLNRPDQRTLLEEMLEKGLGHKEARDRRISNRGNSSEDDASNANVRTAQRMLTQCINEAAKLKKELQRFNDFATAKKVNMTKLGGIKNTTPLASVAAELEMTRKLLKEKTSKSPSAPKAAAGTPPSRQRAKRSAAHS